MYDYKTLQLREHGWKFNLLVLIIAKKLEINKNTWTSNQDNNHEHYKKIQNLKQDDQWINSCIRFLR